MIIIIIITEKKRGKKHNYGIYNICCVLIKFYI